MIREREANDTVWTTKLFEKEIVSSTSVHCSAPESPTVPKYTYKHGDIRPWDVRNDLFQYERNYVVCTKTRHKTPMIRTQSIVSVMEDGKVKE